jgi:N-acetylmuramoyl-L-alanine amidase
MKIVDNVLTRNEYTRPGKLLADKRAVILHWVGVGGQKAQSVWEYFEHGCSHEKKYSSAHYCIDLDGAVLHLIPDDEVAYHCGSSQADPRSGKIYTDWARNVFGRYAMEPQHNSPNNASIGIEMCVIDNEGNFTLETLQAAAKLTASLCRMYTIPLEHVGTHNMVVGWKDCPRLWTRYPDKFREFIDRVGQLL